MKSINGFKGSRRGKLYLLYFQSDASGKVESNDIAPEIKIAVLILARSGRKGSKISGAQCRGIYMLFPSIAKFKWHQEIDIRNDRSERHRRRCIMNDMTVEGDRIYDCGSGGMFRR